MRWQELQRQRKASPSDLHLRALRWRGQPCCRRGGRNGTAGRSWCSRGPRQRLANPAALERGCGHGANLRLRGVFDDPVRLHTYCQEYSYKDNYTSMDCNMSYGGRLNSSLHDQYEIIHWAWTSTQWQCITKMRNSTGQHQSMRTVHVNTCAIQHANII